MRESLYARCDFVPTKSNLRQPSCRRYSLRSHTLLLVGFDMFTYGKKLAPLSNDSLSHTFVGRFFRKCETSFDKRTGYDRAPEHTFDYLNTMKNGSPKEIFQKKEWRNV